MGITQNIGVGDVSRFFGIVKNIRIPQRNIKVNGVRRVFIMGVTYPFEFALNPTMTNPKVLMTTVTQRCNVRLIEMRRSDVKQSV